jgi:hypothetical protein
MAADRGLYGWCSPREGDVDQVELERQPEQFAAEMRRRADAGAGKTVLARIIPDQLHQFRQGFGRHRRIDHHDVRRNRNQ